LHPELWEQLDQSVPHACWLVHAETRMRASGQACSKVLESDPALILAILMLLFERQPVTRAQAA